MTELSLSHLALLFKQQIPAHEVACIVIEPVLGEGGYVPAPKGWLQGLREVCDKEGSSSVRPIPHTAAALGKVILTVQGGGRTWSTTKNSL